MSRLRNVFTFGGPDGGVNRWRRLAGMSVGLVYLFSPVTDLLSGSVTGPKAYAEVAALLAFVATYVATALSPRSEGERGPWTLPLLGATALMSAIFPLLFGGGWLALPIYVTVVISMALPPRAAVAGIVVMAAVVFGDGMLIDADETTIWLLVLQVVTLGILFMTVRNTRTLNTELREAQGEVARLAAGEERLRIARDLHDLLGHSLSLIVLKSELAGRFFEQGSAKAGDEIRDIESVARLALQEVREAVTGYRQRGLTEELDNARAALSAASVTVTVRTSGTPLPDALDGLFGWAVREGVTNVMRHAKASRCDITVTCEDGVASLSVADNGRNAGPYIPGSGLTGLTERVEAAGGTVRSGPQPDSAPGFQLRIDVPYPRPTSPAVPASSPPSSQPVPDPPQPSRP
ncbi:sensor histidine kinase [Sphaerisporangium corydalis]|uniref:Sensor histidine kinase n=1 Tax=Sphaerisporangium corydalis TaxID=1441875 RepID=A0ABV9EMJ7_9ACTN|nr:sensor histidine kinase [Sphaerisporangium corydalis]